MLCQNCGEKEATVHLTKIINNEKTELFLCEDCAEATGQISLEGSEPFSFQDLLAGILQPEVGTSFDTAKKVESCEKCGMNYKYFRENGLFGCAECYNTFGDSLDPLVKRLHGSNRHTGKVPQRKGGDLRLKREIKELKEKMNEAVEEENFERAAEIRDEIHELEDELGGK